MKKIILLLLLIFPLISYSQKKDLPKYYIEGKDTVGIILSMSQLKRMKNDLELKSYLETMAISCDSTISKLVVVVDDYERTISSYRLTISRLDSAKANSTSLLNTCLDGKKEEERLKNLCETQSSMKDTIISNKDKEINTLKIEKAIGWWGSTGLLITTVVLSIILALH